MSCLKNIVLGKEGEISKEIKDEAQQIVNSRKNPCVCQISPIRHQVLCYQDSQGESNQINGFRCDGNRYT